MNCDKCGHSTSVTNTRNMSTSKGFADIPKKYRGQKQLTYRSHLCSNCDNKFKSVEITRDSFDALTQSITADFLRQIGELIK